MSHLNPTELPTTDFKAPVLDQPSNTLTSMPVPVAAAENAAVKTSIFASKPLIIGLVSAIVAGGFGINAGVAHHRTQVAEAAAAAAIVAEQERVAAEAAAAAAAKAAAEQAAAEAAAAELLAAEQARLASEANFPFEISAFDVAHSYVSATWERLDKPTVGTVTVKNFRIIDGDATHEALEGWEWRIADIKLSFADSNANNYGFRYNYLYAMDIYDFDLESDVDTDGDGITTVWWNGQEYDTETVVDLGAEYTGRGFVGGGEWAVHVPIGYDGALFAFTNPALAETAVTASDYIDGDTLWFRMK